MEKAKGKMVDCNNPMEFNDELFLTLGSLMGNMHRITMEYNGNVIMPEFEWYNDLYYSPEYNIILDDDVQVFEKRYIQKLHTFPKSKDCYGIIHGDIHARNFFVDNGSINLFDFEVCSINWYAYDIAKTLLLMVRHGVGFEEEKIRTEFAENYLISYLKGYTQENKISKYWIYKFDFFMKHIITLGYRFGQNTRENNEINIRDWDSDWHKQRIINELPYAFIDYDKIIKNLRQGF